MLFESCTIEHEVGKGEERPCLLVKLFLNVFAASSLSLYDSEDRELLFIP